MWTIYRHICKITGKSYIGQTVGSIEERSRKNGSGYRHNPKLQAAIKKYGWENFDHEVLESGIQSSALANEREQYWIAYYDSIKNGYNILPGGQIDNSDLWRKVYQIDINKNILAEFKSAMDANRILFPATQFWHAREITKCCKGLRSNTDGLYFCFADEYDTYELKHAKNSFNAILQLDKNKTIINKFTTFTAANRETGINISHIKECCDGTRKTAGGWFWCYEIDYQKYIIPDVEHWPESKAVNQIDLKTNKIIKTYPSAGAASKETNINRNNITNCCRGGLKSAGGYKWEFKEAIIRRQEMEKESVKKFDLEAAFKALDEIEIPQTKGIKANRVDLKERFGHKPATETLVEDYYDVSSTEDLEDAKEERDGEIAKAKLARIEKIVDLNAETPEDLLPSYVGKVIMQCPQCMTLFYKNQEDIEPSDENPDVVNLNEPCQHCGNTSGYTLIGKVGAVSEDEADKYDEAPTEENELDLDFDKGTEEVDAEGTGEGAEEMSDEETKEETSDETSSDEDSDLDLNLDEVPEEEPEEEKKEESLNLSKEASENESEHKSENLTLNEEVDKDLDEKLKAHNDYIAYLQQMIKQEEEALKKAENDEIKAAIQRRLDAFTADLEAALPDAVKAEAPVEETEETIEPATDENKAEEKLENLTLTESAESEIDSIIASWGANESLTEESNLDRLLDSDEFKTPVSEEEIDAARREVAKENLEEKCGKQKITEESDSEIAAIINSWEDAPEVPVEESCEGPECESKEECDDCLKEEKEDEAEVEKTGSPEDSEEVCFTAKEVKEVATDVAQSLATPVEDEEEAEKQAKEISEVVDEKVDKAIEEKAEEVDEDETEEDETEEADEEDESDDEESKEETEEPEFSEDDIDELDEDSLNKHIDEYLKEVYSNVKSYKTTSCELKEGKLFVEGKISFNSGKEKLTMFEFLPAYCEGSLFFEGYNKDFSKDKAFTLNCSINESKTLITESFGYKYKINENLVKGLK